MHLFASAVPEPEAPTGAVTIVPVAMETAALAPVRGPEQNGSPVAAVPEVGAAAVRERIARPLELPPARRPTAATLGALAALAGIAAVALGALALVVGLDRGESTDAGPAADTRAAIGLLSKPSTERITLAGSGGRLVLAVGTGGRAVLVVRGLGPAPAGKAYEAWVVGPDGVSPAPAAVFAGTEKVVRLSRLVPPGAGVAVTVESAVGVDVPSQRLRLVARRSA